MTDDNTDAADVECDDDDYLSTSAYHANQTAATAYQFHRREAASRYEWLALF